jgi:hypothetical protein
MAIRQEGEVYRMERPALQQRIYRSVKQCAAARAGRRTDLRLAAEEDLDLHMASRAEDTYWSTEETARLAWSTTTLTSSHSRIGMCPRRRIWSMGPAVEAAAGAEAGRSALGVLGAVVAATGNVVRETSCNKDR